MEERTITITIYWKMLKRLEPALSRLEDEIEELKDAAITVPTWRYYYAHLHQYIGWGRNDDHPILSTSEAWDIAYSHLYGLYSS